MDVERILIFFLAKFGGLGGQKGRENDDDNNFCSISTDIHYQKLTGLTKAAGSGSFAI